MKPLGKKFIGFLLAIVILGGVFAFSALAYRYDFPFPAQISGSLFHSTTQYKTGSTAYVYPDTSTISTLYFISPYSTGYTQATDIVTISSRAYRSFSWIYTPGSTYSLAGCPNQDWWPWPAYNAYGSWGM